MVEYHALVAYGHVTWLSGGRMANVIQPKCEVITTLHCMLLVGLNTAGHRRTLQDTAGHRRTSQDSQR